MAWAVDAALDSGLRPVLVVVGYRGDEVREVAGSVHQLDDVPLQVTPES